jgi:Mrp family chromosome partitioning ATPase
MFTLSLASALSAAEKQVLVIESDLRRPVTASDAREAPGLKAVLRDGEDWRVCLDGVTLAHSDFARMPTGGNDLPELLTSDRMYKLIAELRVPFDFILVDSASFPVASDALVLSQLADVTISLVRLQSTPRALTGEHLRELAALTTDLAVIVNEAPRTLRAPRPPKQPKPKKRKAAAREAEPHIWSRSVAASSMFLGSDPTVSSPKRS